MAININVGMAGVKETKLRRALWNLTSKTIKSRTVALPATPIDGDIYIVPYGSASHAEEVAFFSEGAWLYLVPTEGWLVYVMDTNTMLIYNGADWIEFQPGGVEGAQAVELAIFAAGTLGTDEMLFRYEFTTPARVPAGFTASQGSSGTAATSGAVLGIRKNDVQFGTASWPAGGREPAFACPNAVDFSVGDVLSIIATEDPDPTLADVALTIVVPMTVTPVV